MKKTLTLLCVTFVMTTVAVADDVPPPVPATPAAVDAVVYARPFTLAEGYQFEWSKERPTVKEGMILVLKVSPDLVYPRQCLEPVLYVGNQTAERVNIGYKSSYVIAIVPGKVDLEKSPIWFGTPELPERVDANMTQQERTLADNAKIKPFEKTKVAAATKRGDKKLDAADRDELRRMLVPLIRQYSPDEKVLADTLEAPPGAAIVSNPEGSKTVSGEAKSVGSRQEVSPH